MEKNPDTFETQPVTRPRPRPPSVVPELSALPADDLHGATVDDNSPWLRLLPLAVRLSTGEDPRRYALTWGYADASSQGVR